jgi:uncharacterized pyridoxal phosphate-containing UPF0001 family protein
MDKIKNNLTSFYHELDEICRRVGRKESDVQVLFATKYLDALELVDFINLYQDMYPKRQLWIGENRVQEAERKLKLKIQNSKIQFKSQNLLDRQRQDYKFIMIGTLQKNKVNKALGIFDEIHSVDSVELASALDRSITHFSETLTFKDPSDSKNHYSNQSINNNNLRGLPLANPKNHPSIGEPSFWEPSLVSPVSKKAVLPVFLEVNISGEKSKHGFYVEDLDKVVSKIKQFRYLKIKGLMTMAPYFDDSEKTMHLNGYEP